MQEHMDRSQVRNLSFEKALENHFEAWLLEEKSFNDENHTSIDDRPQIL